MKSIMQELLIKAQRDKSKLVLVKRMVSRNGKTFYQNFWVKPSEVKPSDRVIGGQQNLTNFLTPKVVPKPAAGVLDQAYFDYIKKDKAKALDYLLSCGVQWQQHTHAGINWMRAMQAFNDALKSTQSSQQTAPHPANPNYNAPAKVITLTVAQQNELDSCKNGREKVVTLKKLIGNDNCVAYAKQLGVTWDENAHKAINLMKMSVELVKYFDDKDGTVSPVKQKKGKNNVKDSTQPDNTVIDDKLEIPANAKEREKNLISLINDINDPKSLELVIESGFVPEDDGAKEFIEKSLLKEYNRLLRKSDDDQSYFLDYNPWTLAEEIVDSTLNKMFKGVSKKILKKGLVYSDIFEKESMYQFIHPRETIGIQRYKTSDFSTSSSSLKTLLDNSRLFCNYSSELEDKNGEKFNCTAIGYYGKDSEIYEKQFDLDKEGFVRIIRHISDSNPELKDTAENIISTYGELMKKCHYNPEILFNVLSLSWNEYKYNLQNHKDTVEACNILIKELRNKGLTEDEIKNTVSTLGSVRQIYVKEGSGYGQYKYDANNHLIILDLSYLTMPDGTTVDSHVSWQLVKELNSILKKEKPDSIYNEQLSQTEYDEIIELAYKLVGSKLVDKNTRVDNPKQFHDMSYSDFYEMTLVPTDNDDKIDSVWSNFMMFMKCHALKSGINNSISLSPHSAANKNGTDYTGNYDYYIPDRSISFLTSVSHPYYSTSPSARFNTPDEENSRVNKQISQSLTYSLEYFRKMKDYIKNEGNPNFKKNYWGGKYATEEDARIFSCTLTAKKFNMDKPNPAINMLVDQLSDAAQYCPQNYNTRINTVEKFRQSVPSKSGYVRHQFKDYNAKSPTPQQNVNLKNLREQAFRKANCSLSKVDDSKRKEVESIVKINFDRIDKNGKRVPKADRVYDNRTLVFHSGVYEIKNSQMEDDFQKESQRMNETPKIAFHGTSYSGACGISGIDGKFRFKSSDKVSGQKGSGSMLGEGIYAAKMVGKCCPYIGSIPYTYTSYTANDVTTPDSCSDGVIMVCDAVFGKYGEFSDSNEAKRNNKNNGGTYDSVAVGAGALMPNGGKLKEYECILTRQNMINPRYLVDCGARRR